ncbi:glycosyltransferase [Peribacillus frigoritolerans]|uniref:glycosyltransferase n=1 Tax=Peribacillus frigoritolerans TaxID=450367 RepID=UPI0039A1BF41
MKERKKLIFIGHLPGFGGAEKAMTMVANAMAIKNYSVYLISIGKSRVVYNQDENVNYINIPDINGNKLLIIMNRFLQLKKLFKLLKPDLVIGFWLQASLISTILSKFQGFKVIYSERGDPGDSEYNGLLGIARKMIFPFVDGFVFQSSGAQKFFSKQVKRKSTVIHNPVYIKYDEVPNIKNKRKVIVNVGRLHPQKNQLCLIDAFSKIEKEFDDYRLEIYGEGELKEILQSKIKKSNLEKKVFLMGTTKNITEIIVDSSMFVLSSDYEGMPNALMEGMALGLPCISTNCPPGGPREIINNGVNGLLCTVGDSEEMAICMKKILTDNELAHRISINAKEIGLTHSAPSIFGKWDDYINKFFKDV